MEKKIKIKIKKIGGGNFAPLPKKILDELKLYPSSFIEIIINPIFDEREHEINTKIYMCRSCQKIFETLDKPYCPVCGSESDFIELVEVEKTNIFYLTKISELIKEKIIVLQNLSKNKETQESK
jgi:RNA polymerase subunit RPABC4/transcription elongation factor Spt4